MDKVCSQKSRCVHCVSLPTCAVFRCLTGPSTTASQEGQTERAGNMQLIFQRRFHLPFLRPTCCACWLRLCCLHSRDLHLFLFFYNSPFSFSISLRRSYHGYKTMKDFVRRRRWARYYKKQHWHISISQYICSAVVSVCHVHLTFVVCVCGVDHDRESLGIN